MGRFNRKHAAPAYLILVITLTLSGCAPGERPMEPSDALYARIFRGDPEGCLAAVLECYDSYSDPAAAGAYASVLHPDYRWHFQPGDVRPGRRPFLDREEDVEVTGKIFAAATILKLDISSGIWNELCEYDELPCEGCFSTTREYYIIAQFGENEKIHTGREILFVVVAPDPAAYGQYTILAMHDIDND